MHIHVQHAHVDLAPGTYTGWVQDIYLLRGALGMNTAREERKKVESRRGKVLLSPLCSKAPLHSRAGSKTGNY